MIKSLSKDPRPTQNGPGAGRGRANSVCGSPGLGPGRRGVLLTSRAGWCVRLCYRPPAQVITALTPLTTPMVTAAAAAAAVTGQR